MTRRYLIALARVISAIVLLMLVLWAANFPHSTDSPLSPVELAAARKYYTDIYRKPADNPAPVETDYDRRYQETAEQAAKDFRIVEKVSEFVDRFSLAKKPVLEIGSGRGYLQDVAENYVGLDISPSVARFYHKKFVVGTATALPFPDESFDGVWSIWVFEHVPNPEQAFREMRRVSRDKGVIFLFPAWNVPSWAAEGYEVRPYSDLNFLGKLIKASISVRSSNAFRLASILPVRLSRALAARFGPTALRYERLRPNYDHYWINDSDAVNSIDSYEAALWFLSRGDECLNCGDSPIFLPMFNVPLIIRIHKSAATS
ncbi:MAG: class I SAM-dependent methyltransferase [Chloroflexota bacterium]